MKNKLLTILNQCIYNKTIADFNVINQLTVLIADDITDGISIKYNNDNVYISMWYDGVKLYSILFTDDNRLLCSLPDDIVKTYVIDNSPIGQDCSYNMQYDEIKALLNSDK